MNQREHARSRGQRGWGTWQWPPLSLLGSLTTTSRDRLLEPGTTRQYLAGQVLMREGDITKFVVVLLDGVVKATGLTLDGKEALLAIRVGGDIVGEFAALDEGPRSSTVTTCGTVVGRVIRQADFLATVRRDPVLAEAVVLPVDQCPARASAPLNWGGSVHDQTRPEPGSHRHREAPGGQHQRSRQLAQAARRTATMPQSANQANHRSRAMYRVLKPYTVVNGPVLCLQQIIYQVIRKPANLPSVSR